MVRKSLPFYLIRQPALWIIPPLSGGPLYKVWAAPYMAKTFPLLKLIMTRRGWGAVCTFFFFVFDGLDSNPRSSHPDLGVLLLSQICWVHWYIICFTFMMITANNRFFIYRSSNKPGNKTYEHQHDLNICVVFYAFTCFRLDFYFS